MTKLSGLMTSLDPLRPSKSGIKIDTRYLLNQVPSLIQIRRKLRTWDDFGSSLIRDLQHSAHSSRPKSKVAPDVDLSEWALAKKLIYGVLATDDGQHDDIRRRLGDFQTIPTAGILSALGLWLAGVLGISVTVTKPMVAVILFAVAEANGDWEILAVD